MILTINNSVIIGNGSNNLKILPGVEGFDLPDSNASYVDLPFAERSALNSNRLKDRKIKIKCVLITANFNDFYSVRDTLQRQLYTKDGLTSFKIQTFETPAKSYQFSGVAKIGLPFPRLNYVEFSLDITCPDPFLYALNPVTGSLNFTQAGLFIPFYIPNFLGGAGDNTLVVNNTGNYKTFCDIEITGPGKNFTITNSTTGKTTELGYYTNDYFLGDGRKVTIYGNTKRVTDESGGNRYNSLRSFAALELVPGSNSLVFTAESGNGLNTAATVTFLPRFTHI